MDSIKLTRMLIRLFAVLVIAWTATTSPWIFTNYVTGTNESKSLIFFFASVFLPIFFPILIAIGLWFFAGRISGSVNPQEERFSIDGFTENGTFKIGLFFLGTFISLYATVDLVYHLTFIYIQLTTNDHAIEPISTYPDLIATFFELGLGLFIAFQREGVMRMVTKIRGRN